MTKEQQKYERLTIRHPNGDVTYVNTKQPPHTCEVEAIINRLAELEDKIEDGTLSMDLQNEPSKLKKAKTEAVREFADKLKEQARKLTLIGIGDVMLTREIDELLKEYEE